jgi:predicted dienelactone hydrolase
MRSISLAVMVMLLSIVSSSLADERSEKGAFKVSITLGEWEDVDRNSRNVPWKLYLPEDTRDRAPIVVFSHGGGGSREGNAVLGAHLATHGFACLHIQHAGTDDKAFRSSPRSIAAAANDPLKAEDRIRDVAFVIKQLTALSVTDPKFQKVNAELIGISGHSLGGLTAQVIAGQKITGFGQTLAIPSIKGAFILSPSPPRAGFGDSEQAFGSMMMPLFSVTGTADFPPDKSFEPADRKVPFTKTSGVDQWLLVLDGATHFTFSGNDNMPRIARFLPGMDADPNLARNHGCIKSAAVAFWQLTLNQDQQAAKYLNGDAFKQLIGQNGTIEFKPAKK